MERYGKPTWLGGSTSRDGGGLSMFYAFLGLGCVVSNLRFCFFVHFVGVFVGNRLLEERLFVFFVFFGFLFLGRRFYKQLMRIACAVLVKPTVYV